MEETQIMENQNEIREEFLTPIKQPIQLVDATSSYSTLTENEKLYAHWLSMACHAGSTIVQKQTSFESYDIIQLFLGIFREHDVNTFNVNENRNMILQYVTNLFGNMGNYTSFGDTKFIPRLSQLDFINELVEFAPTHEETIRSLTPVIYSLDKTIIGFPPNMTTYYSENMTEDDIKYINDYMITNNISPINTRVEKESDKKYVLYTASVTSSDITIVNGNVSVIQFKYGDYSKELSRINECLSNALRYAQNENQVDMINKYIEHFHYGDIEFHKESQVSWVRDVNPTIETNIGFVETYRDPSGIRAEFEGFVAVVNKEQSIRFNNLVENAETLLLELPWGPTFEKPEFHRPDFTSLDIITYIASGLCLGICIPNYDDIRENIGYKNVNLGNVISSKFNSNERIELISDDDQELYKEMVIDSFELSVGAHELLGHGSGKLFYKNSDGSTNFDENTINPLTNEQVSTWYKDSETYDSVFGSMASAYEECRAECVALVMSCVPQVLDIFNVSSDRREDMTYISWLSMLDAGLKSLAFYSTEKNKWMQAHCQARYVILRVLMDVEGFITFNNEDNDNLTISINRDMIMSHGLVAIKEFLKRLQIYRSTADIDNAQDMFNEYSLVNNRLLNMREIIIRNQKPRAVTIQHTTYIDDDGNVQLQSYEPTPEGMVSYMLAIGTFG